MTAVDDVSLNRNFLSPLNFQFTLKRAPNVNFFLQKINIPSISLPKIDIPTQFVSIPTQYTHLEFGDMSLSFKVDEDLKNYMEIYNWIIDLGFPDNYRQRAVIDKEPTYTGNGVYSDISLIVLNSAKNPNYTITFQDAYPMSLGSLQFDSTYDDVDYMTVEASFAYTQYTIERTV